MFIRTIHKSAIQTGTLLLVILLFGAALLIWPQAVSGGVSRGLSICTSVIIPSLFPFLILAGFLVRSGVSAALGRHMDGLTRLLFGLPGCCGAGILVGFIGGYPAGGVAVGELVRQGQISREDGRRMLRFCVNGGPAFIISAVGAGLMGSVQIGALLFAAHITASLLLGLLGRLLYGKSPVSEQPPAGRPAAKLPAAAAFVESVNGACRSLLYMCGFVVLFAALLALSDVSGVAGFFHYLFTWPLNAMGADTSGLTCLFPCIMEVSCGCVEAAGTGPMAPLLLGMALGWGGLSVHCQLAATLHEEKLIDRRFFLYRLLHAVLGGVLTVVLFHLCPVATDVFQPLTDAVLAPFTTSAVTSLAMLLMCAMFLLVSSGRKDNG